MNPELFLQVQRLYPLDHGCAQLKPIASLKCEDASINCKQKTSLSQSNVKKIDQKELDRLIVASEYIIPARATDRQ